MYDILDNHNITRNLKPNPNTRCSDKIPFVIVLETKAPRVVYEPNSNYFSIFLFQSFSLSVICVHIHQHVPALAFKEESAFKEKKSSMKGIDDHIYKESKRHTKLSELCK